MGKLKMDLENYYEILKLNILIDFSNKGEKDNV